MYCKEGIFFLAAGLGSVNIQKQQIHIVSPAAPLASLLMHRKGGERISMNGKSFEIIEVA